MGWMTMASTFLPALVVLFFDRLEAFPERWGISGGPAALAFVVLAFALAWIPGGVALATWSPKPMREGVVAGALVAGLMALVLIVAAVRWDDWLIVVLLLPLFGSLAIAFGAAVGAFAARVRRDPLS